MIYLKRWYDPRWNGGLLWKIEKEKTLLYPWSDTRTVYMAYPSFSTTIYLAYHVGEKSATCLSR